MYPFIANVYACMHGVNRKLTLANALMVRRAGQHWSGSRRPATPTRTQSQCITFLVLSIVVNDIVIILHSLIHITIICMHMCERDVCGHGACAHTFQIADSVNENIIRIKNMIKGLILSKFQDLSESLHIQ